MLPSIFVIAYLTFLSMLCFKTRLYNSIPENAIQNIPCNCSQTNIYEKDKTDFFEKESILHLIYPVDA
jgi:hypothetical protein